MPGEKPMKKAAFIPARHPEIRNWTNLGRRSLKRNIIWKQTFTCQSSGWTYCGRDRCSTFPCKDTLTAAGMLAWVRNTRGRVRSGPVLLTWTGQFGYEVFRCLNHLDQTCLKNLIMCWTAVQWPAGEPRSKEEAVFLANLKRYFYTIIPLILML